MPAHHTNDSESLLLRTPAASEAERGHQPEEKAKARGGQVTLSGQVNYLPTPTAVDFNTVAQSELDNNDPKHRLKVAVQVLARDTFLRTPDAYAGMRGGSQDPEKKKAGNHTVTLSDQIEKGANYGRFEPAVRRWEAITGNLAPAPTKPDGKDKNPRLSSHFTEWMMGLEPGWITGVGLSRKDELKACGNGVVPQQAKLALTILLDRLGV
jgi:DNA (cytosine-5)-methyltransferase 1